MITYLIYSTISLGLLLLIYQLLLETEKMHHINRGYLVFSLLFSLTIPLIPVGIGDQLPAIVQSWFSDTTPTTVENPESVPLAGFTESEIPGEWVTPADQTDSAKGFPVFPLMISLYGTVSLFLFARLFRVIHIIQMKADRNPRKLYKNCELVLLREKVVPHTFMSTIFVNRDEYKSGRIGRDILIHEQAHAAQKHTFDLLLIEVLKAIFWFNPLLYLYKRAMQLNHEYLADQAVINAGIKIKEYQSLLLNTILKQPAYGLSHSFTFSLTKKRLQMMTKPISPLRTAIKTFAIIPLFFFLGFLFGCESIPSDSANNQMDIHIEFTDSERIIFNGEEIQVDHLEPKLIDLSERFELHFFLEDHPEMMAGPVMIVNRLVEKYRSTDENKPDDVLFIYITEQSQIRLDNNAYSLEELGRILDNKMTDSNIIINFRVDPEAEFGRILEVQQLLRKTGAFRINYSTIRNEDELNAGVFESDTNIDDLNMAARNYMSITPSEQNLEEMEREFQKFMAIHEAFYQSQIELYSDSSYTPPPPPVVPTPMRRISNTEVSKTLTLPPPSPPAPPAPPVHPRNILQILVNAQGMLLANEQPVEPSNLRQYIIDFIENSNLDPNLPVSPDDAIVSIKTDRRTPYDDYNDMLDELMGAYEDLRNTASINRYGLPFSSLEQGSERRAEIQEMYPKKISIAEPDN